MVISAYVVIPTSNNSEIIYDTLTETDIANNTSHDSFQAFISLFHIKFFVNGAWYGKSYYRV